MTKTFSCIREKVSKRFFVYDEHHRVYLKISMKNLRYDFEIYS